MRFIGYAFRIAVVAVLVWALAVAALWAFQDRLIYRNDDRPLGGMSCLAGGTGFAQCSVGPLAAGERATRSPVIQLHGVGEHVLAAVVGSGGTDPDMTNNRESETTTVVSP